MVSHDNSHDSTRAELIILNFDLADILPQNIMTTAYSEELVRLYQSANTGPYVVLWVGDGVAEQIYAPAAAMGVRFVFVDMFLRAYIGISFDFRRAIDGVRFPSNEWFIFDNHKSSSFIALADILISETNTPVQPAMTTTYSEKLLPLWRDMNHDAFVETWEEGLDYPITEYNPLLALRIRLETVEWFLGSRAGLLMGSLFSELCVDLSIEPAELHKPSLDALHAEFIAMADIFTVSS